MRTIKGLANGKSSGRGFDRKPRNRSGPVEVRYDPSIIRDPEKRALLEQIAAQPGRP